MPPNELVEAQEIRLKLAHVIAGHIGKPFDELKATEVERNQSYDYGESQETVLDIVDEVLKAHEEWLEDKREQIAKTLLVNGTLSDFWDIDEATSLVTAVLKESNCD